MSEHLRFLFMGTGSSLGVPVIGCKCEACTSPDPRDCRMRPGYLITYRGKKIWIDPSQDFRTQALRFHVDHLDGVIITHSHHDHTAGIDDLRVYNAISKKPLPCLMSQETYDALKVRYQYIFDQRSLPKSLVAKMEVSVIDKDRGEIEFQGIRWKYFSFYQAGMLVHGFRIGDFAFLSDIREFPETLFDDLKGVKTMVLSALRVKPSDIHFSIDEAIDFCRHVGSVNTWFTHIAHEVRHTEVEEKLPEGVHLAYDGLEIYTYCEVL